MILDRERAGRLSFELRKEDEEFLTTRRAIVLLSMIGTMALMAVGRFQVGISKDLREPPLPRMKSEEADRAPEAYRYFGIPDAFLGILGMSITMMLAAVGGKRREQEIPGVPLLLTAKLVVDAIVSAKLTVDQWRRHQGICIYCLVAALATFISLPLSLRESRAALDHLGRK